MSTSAYTGEMLDALRANIAYLKTVGDSQIRVRNGELIDAQSDIFIYQFELDFFQNLDTDAEVEVRVNNQSASGKVIAVNDNKIHIQLETNLGPFISEALLVISSYFLLERLVEFISDMDDKDDSLSKKVIGLVQTVNTEAANYIPPKTEMPLNPFQESALRFAIGSDVAYVWGPPGTGKTQTIASIIQGLISLNLSTLLIAHTNAATDAALIHVAKHLKTTEDYQEGRILRIGKISEDLSKYKVVPEKILQEKVKPLHDEIDANAEKIEKLEIKLKKHKSAAIFQEQQNEVKKNVDHLETFISEKKEEFGDRRNRLKSLIDQLKEIDMQIKDFQDKGAFGRMFAGTNLEKLSHQKSLIMSAGATQKELLISMKSEIDNAQEHLDYALNKYKEFGKKGRDEGLLTEDEVQLVEKELNNLKEQQEHLLKEIDKIRDELIKNAKVIASTLTKSYTDLKVLSREYDVVILDEASMAPIPAIYAAASIAKKKVILVGDFFQLPPIAKHEVNPKNKTPEEVKYEEDVVNKWLKRDVFELAGITKAVRQGLDSPMLRQLKIQYRMHPDISKLINYLVYAPKGEGKYRLENGPDTDELGKISFSSLPLKDAHIGFYDTTELGALPVKSESGSYYNIANALLAMVLVKQALKTGYKKIGVISAYRAQVNLLQKMIDDILTDDEKEKVIADTVHRFQGGERELIIFDVTTPKSPSMYDDYGEEGDDMKLMNVALSRAQQKCIILADVAAVKRKHSESSLVRKAITFCEAMHNPFVAAEGVLPKYTADDRTEEWLAKINLANLEDEVSKSTIFNEKDFYPSLMRDILKTKQELVICSPFITSYRVRQFVPVFNHLIDKGVRIFLITKPPDKQKDNMREVAKTELKKLESFGVTILPMIGEHEKVAMIDRNIVYAGSLNILSQRDSKEQMYRFVGKNVATQMAGFMKIDKNIGALGENNLVHCEVCKDIGAWYWTQKGRFGVWTFCLANVHAKGKPPKTKAERQVRKDTIAQTRQTVNLNSEGIPVCPVHEVATVLKRGPFSEFYGCPLHKECGYAVSKAKVEKIAKTTA